MSVQVTVPSLSPEDLEKVVDADLDAFNDWFRENVEQGTGIGLIKPERAMLKTYLWYKTHPGEKPKRVGG